MESQAVSRHGRKPLLSIASRRSRRPARWAMDNAGATPKLDSSRTVEEVAFRELRFPAAQEFQAWRWTGVDTFECNWHKLATGCPTPGCDCGGHFGIPCNLNHFLDIVESCLEDDRHDDRPLIVDDASRWLADPSVTCGLAIIPEEPFPAQQRRCLTTWFAPFSGPWQRPSMIWFTSTPS